MAQVKIDLNLTLKAQNVKSRRANKSDMCCANGAGINWL